MREIKNIRLNRSTLRVIKILKSVLLISGMMAGVMGSWAILVWAVNYLIG